VESAATAVEELRDELRDWRDNLPENLEGGDSASELDDAIEESNRSKTRRYRSAFQSSAFRQRRKNPLLKLKDLAATEK